MFILLLIRKRIELSIFQIRKISQWITYLIGINKTINVVYERMTINKID